MIMWRDTSSSSSLTITISSCLSLHRALSSHQRSGKLNKKQQQQQHDAPSTPATTPPLTLSPIPQKQRRTTMPSQNPEPPRPTPSQSQPQPRSTTPSEENETLEASPFSVPFNMKIQTVTPSINPNRSPLQIFLSVEDNDI